MESQTQIDRAKRNEDAATAWYTIKGTISAADLLDKTLVTHYGEDPVDLAERRLANFERALDTLRELIAEHAPDYT